MEDLPRTNLHPVPPALIPPAGNPYEYYLNAWNLQGIFPRITYLDEFLDHREWKIGPTNPEAWVLNITDTQADWKAIELLPLRQRQVNLNAAFDEPSRCKLFVIQGITPDMVVILGAKYQIPPQFFGDHLVADTWYAEPTYLGNSKLSYPYWISENLPPLPSELKTHKYFQFRYLDARLEHGGDIINEYEDGVQKPDLTPEKPNSKPCGHKLHCFKRQVSFWYNKQPNGWIGVLLCEPHFTDPKFQKVGQPMFREFLTRLNDEDKYLYNESNTLYTGVPLKGRLNHTGPLSHCRKCRQHSLECRQSFIETLKFYINHTLAEQDMLREARNNIFIVLKDAYRLTASQWMVVHQIFNRDLRELEEMLGVKSLSIIVLNRALERWCKRRAHLLIWKELIQKAKAQCNKDQLDELSITAMTHADVVRLGKDLEEDFNFVADTFESLQDRVEKNIGLVSELINIRSAEEASILSKLVGIFGPLSLSLSLFSLPKPWGFGGDRLGNTTLPVLVALGLLIPLVFSYRTLLWGLRGVISAYSDKRHRHKRQKEAEDDRARQPEKSLDPRKITTIA